jgi:hypothetical protein
MNPLHMLTPSFFIIYFKLSACLALVTKVVSEQLYAFPVSCMHAASEPTLRTWKSHGKEIAAFYTAQIFIVMFKNPNTGLYPSQLNSFLAIIFDLLNIHFDTICSSIGRSSNWCFVVKFPNFSHLHASSMCDVSHLHFNDYPRVIKG